MTALLGVAASAWAVPVVCDPAEAARIVADARVNAARVPVTHPWLVPGLARGEPAVGALLDAVCAPGGDVVVEREESHEASDAAAYTLAVVRVEAVGCSLVRRRVGITVAVSPAGLAYRPGRPLVEESTPLPGCADPPRWRDETVLAGEGGPVRLVRTEDHVGDAIVATGVAVRHATAAGWREQVLLEPAPPRTADPAADGPELLLARTRATDEPLVVATHDRAGCVGVPGQTVWHLEGDGRFVAETGRAAAERLARDGAWRLAGQDGWFVVLGQDGEGDRDLVEPRRRRLQKKLGVPLRIWDSSDFPGLNAGYVFIAPAPFASEAEAAASRAGRPGAYVKRAWQAPPACAPGDQAAADPSGGDGARR